MNERTFLEKAAALGLYEGTVIQIIGVFYNPFTVTADGIVNCHGRDVTEQLDGLLKESTMFRAHKNKTGGGSNISL